MRRHQASNFLCERAVEFRAKESDDADGMTLVGYAAVFDTPTMIQSWEGEFEEDMRKGAFKKTLREKTPVIQFNHGHDMRVGSVPIGVFRKIEEDTEGLYVEAPLFDNDLVKPVRQAVEGGAITGMSIKFTVVRDEWRDKDGKKIKPTELYELLWNPGDRGPLKRTILEVKLMEAGPVVFPAYTDTSVGMRSDDNPFSGMSEEDVRSAVTESYTRRMPRDTPEDAVPERTSEEAEDAAPEGTSSDSPDAVPERTSEGVKKEITRKPFKRLPVKREAFAHLATYRKEV